MANRTSTLFPSPHGDKFQLLPMLAAQEGAGFRPLTGINFNN